MTTSKHEGSRAVAAPHMATVKGGKEAHRRSHCVALLYLRDCGNRAARSQCWLFYTVADTLRACRVELGQRGVYSQREAVLAS